MQFLFDFLSGTWSLVAEMAPYLLFGFAVAGLLHILVRREFVEHWLGRPGIRGVISASVVGVPMPLCSCSVIPVAASMRKSGATRGATASFLSSTPQTGVDSIVATYALLGGLFTAVRVGVAFICGIVAGYLIERFCGPSTKDNSDSPRDNSTQESEQARSEESCCSSNPPENRNFPEAIRYGFVDLPADLGKALIVGLLLAGLITALLPADLLSGSFSSGIMAFVLATLISVPLYVCATASIPMAFALIAAGLSPGAALVFLIAGPATNTATIATVWKMLGHRATGIYLGSLLVISWLAGWSLNASIAGGNMQDSMHAHESSSISLWQHGAGILLVAVLIFALWKTAQPKKKSCCQH